MGTSLQNHKQKNKGCITVLLVAFFALVGGLAGGLIGYWVWVTGFSKACLKPPYVGEESEDLINSMEYQRFLTDSAPQVRDRYGAARIAVFLYDSSVNERALYFRSDLKANSSGALNWVRLERDEMYLDQKEFHLKGKCWSAETKKIKDGILKSSNVDQGLGYIVSCPIANEALNKSIMGYVSLGFIKAPSAVKKVLIQDSFSGERILSYRRRDKL